MHPPLMNAYSHCTLCPQLCRVDRLHGEIGICGESSTVRVAWSGLHRGEEPPISGEKGGGMIFFSGCPLHCQYCQNRQISGVAPSWEAVPGVEVTIEELSCMMTGLEAMGAATINLVTGTHFIPSIIEAIRMARAAGLTLDIVWNSSGFERVEALRLIDASIDLYLIDLKTLDPAVSRRFCATERYARTIEAVMDFIRLRGVVTALNEEGRLRGALVRHLVFPGQQAATREVLNYYAQQLKASTWLSLMVQFEPPAGDVSFPPITEEEYQGLMDLLDELGIEEGFVQELGENVSWIPDFTRDNPFPEGFAEPLEYFLTLRRSSSR